MMHAYPYSIGKNNLNFLSSLENSPLIILMENKSLSIRANASYEPKATVIRSVCTGSVIPSLNWRIKTNLM